MTYNLAAASAIRGQFEFANKLMQKICGVHRELPEGKYPIHMLMLIVYVQLKLGMIFTLIMKKKIIYKIRKFYCRKFGLRKEVHKTVCMTTYF